MTDEEQKKKEETEISKNTRENNDEGNKSKTVRETERLNKEREELDLAIAKKKEADARAKLAGVTSGNQNSQKKELTNQEYKDYILEHGKPPEQ